MTKTTWIGKAAVLAVCLAVVTALVLAAISDPADAKKKKRPRGGGIAGFALNSDLLDGKDSSAFFSGETYQITDDRQGPGGGQVTRRELRCDVEDKLLGGGGSSFSQEDNLYFSRPQFDFWAVEVQDNGSPSFIVGRAICADFPPLRSENAAQSEPNQENAAQSNPNQ